MIDENSQYQPDTTRGRRLSREWGGGDPPTVQCGPDAGVRAQIAETLRDADCLHPGCLADAVMRDVVGPLLAERVPSDPTRVPAWLTAAAGDGDEVHTVADADLRELTRTIESALAERDWLADVLDAEERYRQHQTHDLRTALEIAEGKRDAALLGLDEAAARNDEYADRLIASGRDVGAAKRKAEAALAERDHYAAQVGRVRQLQRDLAAATHGDTSVSGVRVDAYTNMAARLSAALDGTDGEV